ncbi:hypothetical protein [Blautia wexlerae]|uniref:hypothetical protein n=1 Tax=Blautia wexlerae TaxID=418240 RepID=UPI00189D07CA|nr:hypothetical protein [Blautia wexlerae]
MGYSIELKNRTIGETAKMRHPQYVRTGSLWAVTDPVTGKLTPAEQTEADIDITCNYSHYYYEVADGDIRFAHEEVSAYYADETQGPAETEYGIRGLYGSTSAEPIPMLMDVIVMAMNCLMGKDVVWSGGLKKRRAQCSSLLIVVQ